MKSGSEDHLLTDLRRGNMSTPKMTPMPLVRRNLTEVFLKMDPPRTPPKRSAPEAPALKLRKKRRTAKTFSTVLLGRVLEACDLGTPVKEWPKPFWQAREAIYEGEEKPATPVKLVPLSFRDETFDSPVPIPKWPQESPQDIFK